MFERMNADRLHRREICSHAIAAAPISATGVGQKPIFSVGDVQEVSATKITTAALMGMSVVARGPLYSSMPGDGAVTRTSNTHAAISSKRSDVN